MKKFLERAMWFYPAAQTILILKQIHTFFFNPTFTQGLYLFFLIYLLSPLLYRLISLYIPIKTGKTKFGPEHEPSGWMIAHRLQMIYYMFPFLESFLNSLPGVYSNWLRLWGSNIGRLVYWAPDVKIYDRTHLTVGDRTFVGGSLLSCHLAIPKTDGTIEIFFSPITIGAQVFVSTQSNIGPGTQIQDKEFIKIQTQTMGKKKVSFAPSL